MDKQIDIPPWYQFVGEIDWLLNDIDYAQVTMPLAAIRDTVVATKRVNDAQRQAVERIRARVGGA
jgi:hypothetical protein